LTKKHITNKHKINITNNLDINLKQSKVYSCNCGKVFNREDNLLRHYKNSKCIQKKSSEHQCKNCGKKYSTSFNLNKHLKKCFRNTNSNSNNLDNSDNKNVTNWGLIESMYQELLNSKNDLVAEKDKRLAEKDYNKNELISIFKEQHNLNTQLLLNQQEKLIQVVKESNPGNTIYNQTNNMTNSNYVLQFFNYTEADSMDKIKSKFKMTRDEFLKASDTNGYRGALFDKAERMIIQPYLEYQFKRPIHTVDSSRKKALYKDDDHDKWTFNPKTTLSHCFNEFHKSALEHQDQTIKENPNWVITGDDNNLYKQTYFIPTEMKDKESIFREVKNHIYKETKVKRDVLDYKENYEIENNINDIQENILINNICEEDNICEKDNIYEKNNIYKKIIDCAR
jgi:hypothetical protein